MIYHVTLRGTVTMVICHHGYERCFVEKEYCSVTNCLEMIPDWDCSLTSLCGAAVIIIKVANCSKSGGFY